MKELIEQIEHPEFTPAEERFFKRLDFEFENPDGTLKIKENEGGEVDVYFTNREGERLDLKNLLPKDCSFAGGVYNKKYINALRNNGKISGIDHYINLDTVNISKDVGDPIKRVVYLGPEFVKREGGKIGLGILHEIGHLKLMERDPELEEERQLLIEKGEGMHRGGEFDFLKSAEIRSQHERFAWAYALNTARKLKKNFNLTCFFKDRKDVEEFIHMALRGYKIKYKDRALLLIEGRVFEDMGILKKIDSLFTKKSSLKK